MRRRQKMWIISSLAVLLVVFRVTSLKHGSKMVKWRVLLYWRSCGSRQQRKVNVKDQITCFNMHRQFRGQLAAESHCATHWINYDIRYGQWNWYQCSIIVIRWRFSLSLCLSLCLLLSLSLSLSVSVCLSLSLCVCVCVYLSLSLSLTLSIYIYIYLTDWAVHV